MVTLITLVAFNLMARLLLDLHNNEYSEFRVDTDRDCNSTLYQALNGGRYKLFVYRTTPDPINLFFSDAQTYVINGTKDGEAQSLLILDIEVATLNGKLINRIGATSEKLEEIVKSLTTNTIKISEAFTFNGVSLGGYADGDTVEKDTLLHDYLKKTAQKTLPVTYTAPSMGLTPSSTSVEAGTIITPSIIASFTQKDAGALNRYLLQLSTDGADDVSLIDAAALQTYNQAAIVVGDGQYLKYTSSIFYDEGITKINNVGEEDPTGKILAGSLSKMLIYTGIRNCFYGVDTNNSQPSTSAQIRALAGIKSNPVNGSTFNINIAEGTKRIIFAYPATLRDVSSVQYVELGNGEVGDTFTKLTYNVEGVNGFNAIAYKIYVCIVPVAFNASATYKVII